MASDTVADQEANRSTPASQRIARGRNKPRAPPRNPASIRKPISCIDLRSTRTRLIGTGRINYS